MIELVSCHGTNNYGSGYCPTTKKNIKTALIVNIGNNNIKVFPLRMVNSILSLMATIPNFDELPAWEKFTFGLSFLCCVCDSLSFRRLLLPHC